MRYTVSQSGGQITCLPADLDTTDFLDASMISEGYTTFVETRTGKIHRSEEYYLEAQMELA